MKLAIYGAGGLGREVLELAKQINTAQPRWETFCFIDDINPERQLRGLPVVTLDTLCAKEYEIAIAVGEPALRRVLADKARQAGFHLPVLVHPAAQISAEVTLSEGCIVSCGAFISCDTTIGRNVYLQPNTSLGHDCQIGDDCVISSIACLAGHCKVGTGTFIGMGAMVRENTTIGEEVIISMGAAVFSDIAPGVVAMGNPARAMRRNDDKKVFR